jgi:regulator of sirC expression with transglutaminase-like and TPR domain
MEQGEVADMNKDQLHKGRPTMSPTLPMCCSPQAFAILSRQVASLNSPDALLHGAIAIAMHQMEGIDIAHVDATLQGYADTVRSRVRGSQPQALLAHLHDVLFDEVGFAGNTDDYYSTSNSYLPIVLETKRGLPISLSMIYKIVAERLGLRAWGIGLPGHFLAGLDVAGQTMLVDPFDSGRMLTFDEAHERMQEIVGPDVEWSDEMIQPVSNRHWLTRMLQNLLHVFSSTCHYADVAAVLEMEMLLWPEQDRLQRDLALVLARVGLTQPASVWLNRYLDNNPDDPQKLDLKQLLEVLTT